MLNFIRFFLKYDCALVGHDWEKTRTYIRECRHCGREEALFWNRFPRIDEPAYTWQPSPDQCMQDSIKMMDDST